MATLKHIEYTHMYTDPDNFCAEASVVNLGGGVVLATFIQNRGLFHTDTGRVLVIRSTDSGRTWNRESVAVAMEQGEDFGYNIAAIAKLADGTLLVHANRWRFLDDGKIDWFRGTSDNEGVFLVRSEDGGHSWSEPAKVNMAPMRSAWVRDSITELPDGKLLMPLHGFLKEACIPEIDSSERERAFVLCSEDGGRRWHYWGTIAIDPALITHYHEPSLQVLPDGSLVSLIRTQRYPRKSGPGEQMAPPSGYLFASYSHDGGISWSVPYNTGLWGYPADTVRLPDGRVLVAFGRRLEPMGVYAALSDDGKQWSADRTAKLAGYDIGKVTPAFPVHPDEPQSSVRMRGWLWHIGYPSSAVLDDGRILTVYHMFNEAGRQYIEGAIYTFEE